MNLIDQAFGSSTPDGLAPLSQFGVFIFVLVLGLLSVTWGVFNFLKLMRIGPKQQQSELNAPERLELIRQMGQKIILGSLHYMKFNTVICLGATIIFFLVIMGGIQGFHTFSLSLSYLSGSLFAMICGVLSIISFSLSYFRVIYSSRYSSDVGFATAKNGSNFITFFTLGLSLIILYFLIYFNTQTIMKPVQISHVGNMLISFSFGFLTTTIATKITSLVYTKGVESAFYVNNIIQGKLSKNQRHPLVICKGIGQTVNKGLAKSLDYIFFFILSIAISTKIAATNIVGTDQRGEIIFDLSSSNIYLPVIAMSFGIFFFMIFSIVIPTSATSQDQVSSYFNKQILITTIFLFGFLSLACYLSLPAQFQVMQFIKLQKNQIKEPYLPYLCMITGMTTSILIAISSQIMTSHPFFMYALLGSCKTGAATCLIFGLSFGYLYNIFPIIGLVGITYLWYWWLGVFGVAMGGLGVAMYIIIYMVINGYFSIIQQSSMIAYINKTAEQTINTLLMLGQAKKSFQHKNLLHLYQLTIIFGYALIQIYLQSPNIQNALNFNLVQPRIFSGLLVGSMLPYTIACVILKASNRVGPVICYDVFSQMQQNPGLKNGNVQPDHYRTNYVFTLNTSMQILRFLPSLLLPFLIMGLLTGPRTILGACVGLIISGVQLAISNGISGLMWSNVKNEITFGRARDEQNQLIKHESQWGRSAQVGNDVGSILGVCVSQLLYTYIMWVVVMSVSLQNIFFDLHK